MSTEPRAGPEIWEPNRYPIGETRSVKLPVESPASMRSRTRRGSHLPSDERGRGVLWNSMNRPSCALASLTDAHAVRYTYRSWALRGIFDGVPGHRQSQRGNSAMQIPGNRGRNVIRPDEGKRAVDGLPDAERRREIAQDGRRDVQVAGPERASKVTGLCFSKTLRTACISCGSERAAAPGRTSCVGSGLLRKNENIGGSLWRLTFDMSGGPKGAKRPLRRPLDGNAKGLPTFWHRRRCAKIGGD